MDSSALLAQVAGITPLSTVESPEVSLAYLVNLLVFYVFTAYCLQVIAKKTNTPNKWMAWVPVFSFYLMCKAAGKPGWWVILFFIPIVNIVFTILVGIELAKALRKPVWAGVILIFPFISLFGWGYLAFAKPKEEVMVAVPTPPEVPTK